MEDNEKLVQRIQALEERVEFLEETVKTLTDISASETAQKYIEKRQQALAVSKLLNSASPSIKINEREQEKILSSLTKQKEEIDKKITEAVTDNSTNMQEASENVAGSNSASEFNYNKLVGALEISGYNGFDKETIVMPSIIDGKRVTSIGTNAFKNMEFLKRAVLPENCTVIGENAFMGCHNLESVELLGEVRSIGNQAFSSCYRLKQIEFGNELTRIGKWAFYFTGITEIALPEKIRTIEEYAFYHSCLTSITLNEGLEIIKKCAFRSSHLRKIVLPTTLKMVEGKDGYTDTVTGYRIVKDFPFERGTQIAVMGKNTQFEQLSGGVIVYCSPGSVALQQAREEGVEVHPLSDFKLNGD